MGVRLRLLILCCFSIKRWCQRGCPLGRIATCGNDGKYKVGSRWSARWSITKSEGMKDLKGSMHDDEYIWMLFTQWMDYQRGLAPYALKFLGILIGGLFDPPETWSLQPSSPPHPLINLLLQDSFLDVNSFLYVICLIYLFVKPALLFSNCVICCCRSGLPRCQSACFLMPNPTDDWYSAWKAAIVLFSEPRGFMRRRPRSGQSMVTCRITKSKH